MARIQEEFGAFVKDKRLKKDMTQQEVADKLLISQQAYGRYELGKRNVNIEVMVEIAKVLNFSVSEFFDDYIEER